MSAACWSLALALGLGTVVPVGRALEVSAQAGATWSDNLSRTSAPPNRKSAATYAASATVVQVRQLSRNWQLFASGEAGVETVPDYAALNATHGGLALRLRRKFGLGPLAPVLDLNAGLTGVALHESGRSGWKTEAGLTLGQRLTETWRVAAGGGWQEYYASHHPFDLRSHRLTLETGWDVTGRWSLAAGAARQWGELTANAAGRVYQSALTGGLGPRVADYYNRIPWEVANTFGPGWVAYRIDNVADFRWLQLSYSFGANTAVSLRYETVKVVNRAAVRYDTDMWSLSIARRF